VQKNEAAAVMVLTSFIGLYVTKVWSRPAGFVILAAALVFLLKTDSKTAIALLPVILVLAAAFEKWRTLRLPMVFGGVLALNLGTVGVVAFPVVRGLVAATGIDPTFTARSDIWKLALSAIGQKPLTGHGLEAFWQSPALVGSDLRTQTWATAAVDAHNAYLDAMVTAGIPGLVLLLAWVLWTPLRDFNAAERAGNVTPLTRLFLRIWLFTIFQACLESIFLQTSGAGWFTFLVAVFGLRYQARYALKPSLIPEARPAAAAYG
jgi:O-antigen ligase